MPHSPSLTTSTRPSVSGFASSSVVASCTVHFSVTLSSSVTALHSRSVPSGSPSDSVTVAFAVDTAMRASWSVGAASFTLNVSSASSTVSSVVAISGSATRDRSTPPPPATPAKSSNGSSTVSAASAV